VAWPKSRHRDAARADEIGYARISTTLKPAASAFRSLRGGEHIEADKSNTTWLPRPDVITTFGESSPAKLEARPGVLDHYQPFSFQGNGPNVFSDRLHPSRRFVTNCNWPKPWWISRQGVRDQTRQERNRPPQIFRLKRVPLLYAPKFTNPWSARRGERLPDAQFRHSSRRGLMFGGAAIMAINRSYDADVPASGFTQRGVAHHVDFPASRASAPTSTSSCMA